eukprot:GEZU01004551.1.p1 GENE.GEZU01004551.1~~GEZU01004551.1.p1  ORF type:complete len:113 (+),score=4.07 GEZU01004551.1:37-375(+)
MAKKFTKLKKDTGVALPNKVKQKLVKKLAQKIREKQEHGQVLDGKNITNNTMSSIKRRICCRVTYCVTNSFCSYTNRVAHDQKMPRVTKSGNLPQRWTRFSMSGWIRRKRRR